MSQGRFTPASAALILIDHQSGVLQLVKTLDVERVKRHALALARAAKILNMPVVLTSSMEDYVQGPLLPEFAQILPEAYANRVKRAGIVNAWNDPGFKSAVLKTGRRQLIMGGITTDVCLIFPALSAVAEGFEVQAVLDVSGSPYEFSEFAARQRMERAGVQFTATNTIIAELAQDWATPQGGELIQVLFQDVLPPIALPT
jgi:nicotinamidase-related amidase